MLIVKYGVLWKVLRSLFISQLEILTHRFLDLCATELPDHSNSSMMLTDVKLAKILDLDSKYCVMMSMKYFKHSVVLKKTIKRPPPFAGWGCAKL